MLHFLYYYLRLCNAVQLIIGDFAWESLKKFETKTVESNSLLKFMKHIHVIRYAEYSTVNQFIEVSFEEIIE